MINYGLSISLATLDREDLECLRDYRNSYEIRRWCRQNNLISGVAQNVWFDEMSHDKTIRMYTIINSESVIVGACGLTSIDLYNRRAEFSCYIAPNWQRCGYARDALKTLFSFGFLEMNLHQIWGETFEGNPALHLFQSLKMKATGVQRQFYYKNGKYLDATIISILKSEWDESEWKKQLSLS